MSDTKYTRQEFFDGKVVLYGGDNRDVLRDLPDNSIDSIVTDPPYALVSIVKRFGKPGSAPAKGNDAYMRASAGFMGKQWDTGEVAFSEVFWAECLRVLKPGGHVAAFSGTRTYHRMACAIEDAGFEIRDSLMWVYGTGFPKSHDVSKGIDSRKDWKSLAALGAAIKAARTKLGLSQTEAARRVGLIAENESLGGGGFMWFETGRMPTRDEWPRIKAALSLSDDFDEAFEAAEREVIGTQTHGRTDDGSWAQNVAGGMFKPGERTREITKPLSALAREWEGWGTALKPSHEPITVATKPLTVQQHFAILLDYLTDLLEEQTIWFGLNAHVAERSFSAIRVKLDAVTKPFVLDSAKMRVLANFDPARFADHSSIFQEHGFCVVTKTQDDFVQSPAKQSSSAASYLALTTPHGPADDLSIQLAAMCMSVVTEGISENTVSSWVSISDAILSRANTFTIETASRLTIALRTWNSLTSPNTIDGTGSLFPNVSPIVLARKPLSEGTVAANVLRWGTGALNIDACRVASGDGHTTARKPSLVKDTSAPFGKGVAMGGNGSDLGRWPANVVHDGSDEVVAAFPSAGGQQGRAKIGGAKGGSIYGKFAENVSSNPEPRGDSGSAARFFYSAKASKADRAGSKHPTVKPVSLKEWLATLITPPGGTILDPFAGSGTTGAAARNKGFRAVLIEREAEYVEDIKRRLSTPALPHVAAAAAVQQPANDNQPRDLFSGLAA